MNDLEADLLIANAKIKQLEEQLAAERARYAELQRYNVDCTKQCGALLVEKTDLMDQLSESQRREQAAIHDIMCRDHCDVCVSGRERDNECKNADYDCLTCKSDTCACRECRDEDHWQWRGPQEAGEGEHDTN